MLIGENTIKRAIVGKTDDRHYQTIRIDPTTHALQIIDYEHAEIHSGSSYDYSSFADQTINHVWDIQVVTSSSKTIAHFTFGLEFENETEWYFYEDVVIGTSGTPVTPVNHLRSSDKTSLLTIGTITNTTIGNAESDTTAAAATALVSGMTGSGKKAGGGGASRQEWLLKPSTNYCFRFVATAAGWVSWHLDWYEHTPRGV